MDLKAEQEEMRRRWLRLDGEPDGSTRKKPRKRGVRPISQREQRRLQIEQEQEEIAELRKRTDLLCPICRENPTTVAKTTGELKLCRRCDQRRRMLAKYDGMTIQQFNNLLEEQEGDCAICGEHMDEPHVDHSHAYGHVRGLLCPLCNAGLGFFRDNPEIIERASKYVILNRLSRKKCTGTRWR